MSQLAVRRPSIAIEQFDLTGNWLGDDPFRTHLFNAMSMMFPIGEKYFIDSVKNGLKLLSERPDLRREAIAFIGQEAAHTQLHLRFNAQLAAAGLRNRVEPIIAWRIRLGERLGARDKLAVTMAYEHFTACFGDATLSDAGWLDGAAAEMRLLWEWHAAEECEHRAVSFDLYQALGGGVARRIAWFGYASLMFGIDVTVQTLSNLHRSGQWRRWRAWRGAGRFMFGRRGVLATLIPAWFAYLKPSFHPTDGADPALAARWLSDHAALFARNA